MASSGYKELPDSATKGESEHQGPKGNAPLHPEDMNTPEAGLTTAEAERRLARDGLNQLPEKKVNACLNFLKYYWGPMPCCIWAAIIIELIRLDWIDFGVLSLLQFL